MQVNPLKKIVCLGNLYSKSEHLLLLWNGIPFFMTSVWRLGQNILKHTPPTVRFLWMRDREEECKNKTLPSIQYSVSAGNTSLHWNKVGCNFRFTQTLKYTPLSVYVRDAFRISTWSLSRGLCFQVRNSRHSLFFCWRLSNSVTLLQVPPSGLGVNCLYSS